MVACGLKEQVQARISHLIDFSANELGIIIPKPKVIYNIRGTKAGTANFNHWVLDFNPKYLSAYRDEFIVDTVSHEVAHLVTVKRHGTDIFPHGRQWQSIMRAFGLPPKITHNYA